MDMPKKCDLVLLYIPAIPLVGISPPQKQNNYLQSHFYSNAVHIAKIRNQPRWPSNDDKIKKMYILQKASHLYKKECNLIFCNKMDPTEDHCL